MTKQMKMILWLPNYLHTDEIRNTNFTKVLYNLYPCLPPYHVTTGKIPYQNKSFLINDYANLT